MTPMYDHKREVLIQKAYLFLESGRPLPDYLARLLAQEGVSPASLLRGGDTQG